jgi:uncharacterized alkaline shock family protein YloU
MTKVAVTVEIEFETKNEGAARAAVIRIPGDIVHSIQHGVTEMTGVKAGSVKVNVTHNSFS